MAGVAPASRLERRSAQRAGALRTAAALLSPVRRPAALPPRSLRTPSPLYSPKALREAPCAQDFIASLPPGPVGELRRPRAAEPQAPCARRYTPRSPQAGPRIPLGRRGFSRPAVIPGGGGGRDETALQVRGDGLRRAFGRVSVASAARRFHAQPVTGGNVLLALAVERRARTQPHRARRAVAPAAAAPRGPDDAVQRGGELEGRLLAGADLDDLAVAAAAPPGAAGIGPQLAPPDDQRRRRLRHLDLASHHARRVGGGVQPVAVGPAAGPAVVHQLDGEGSPGAALEMAEAAAQRKIPEHADALGRDGARPRLVQAAEGGVGKKLADDVAHRHRRGLQRIHDGALRRGDDKGLKGAGVVGNVGRDDAFGARTPYRPGRRSAGN